MSQEELEALVGRLQEDLRRAKEAEAAYQSAWKDEIDKRAAAERRENNLLDGLRSLINRGGHITAKDIVALTGFTQVDFS